jgi:hypothetical protein
MDAVEETIDSAHLDELRKLRAQEHRFLIIKEPSLGCDDKYLKPAKLGPSRASGRWSPTRLRT